MCFANPLNISHELVTQSIDLYRPSWIPSTMISLYWFQVSLQCNVRRMIQVVGLMQNQHGNWPQFLYKVIGCGVVLDSLVNIRLENNWVAYTEQSINLFKNEMEKSVSSCFPTDIGAFAFFQKERSKNNLRWVTNCDVCWKQQRRGNSNLVIGS